MRRHTSQTGGSRAAGIAAVLRQQLADGRYAAGDRFPSQNELARTFKTSTVTAREAALLLVRDGLLERRFGSGTYVTGRSPERFVAVVTELDIAHPSISPAYLTMLQAVRRTLAEAGLQTRVYIGHATPFGQPPPQRITAWEFWHDLEEGRITGLVTVGTDATLGREAVAGRAIPFIDGIQLDGVRFWDSSELVRKGVAALVGRGCRRVACVAEGKEPTNAFLDLFRREALRHGLESRQEWRVLAPYLHERGDGAAAFRSLWMSHADKPDGLLVLDDMLYHDMAPAFLLNGIRVPHELVVASHANVQDARPFVPEPIRLVADMAAVGAAMARNLVLRLKDPQAPAKGIPVPVRVAEAENGGHRALLFSNATASKGRRGAACDTNLPSARAG